MKRAIKSLPARPHTLLVLLIGNSRGTGFYSLTMAPPSNSLFAYGTLQHPDVMRHVLGRIPESTPAWLQDYARYRIVGFDFPGIIPQGGARVEGTRFHGITPEEWLRLDTYEADFYERLDVTVQSPDATHAFAYVVPARNQHVISTDLWELKTYKPGPDSGIL